jgi:hypothetical protein
VPRGSNTSPRRSGGYNPDPIQVANHLLSDAEGEARIQAMLNP